MVSEVYSDPPFPKSQTLSQSQLGAEWIKEIKEAEDRLLTNSFPVIIFQIPREDLGALLKLLQEYRKRSPRTNIIFITDGFSWSDLLQITNKCKPFRLINTHQDPNLERSVMEAFSNYCHSKQNSEFAQLLEDQNEGLKKLNNEVSLKITNHQTRLDRSRTKQHQTNLQVAYLRKTMFAINQAKSPKEIESLLDRILKKCLRLSDVKIDFFSKKNSRLEAEPIASPKNPLLHKTPIYSDDFQIGNAYFARSIQAGDFTKMEKEFLHQVTEAIALAINRFRSFENIQTLKAQWQSTFDAIAEPLCITDEQFRIIRTNFAFRNACEKSHNDLLNTNCFLSLTGRSTPPEIRDGHFSFRLSVPTQDGMGTKTHDVRIQPLRSKLNEHPTFLVIFRDITLQLRLERQVLEAEKMAELGIISSSIAHELNNPLGGIMSFLQLIRMELEEDSEILEDIVAMEEATNRCKELVENLLGFARQEEVGSATNFDLRDTINQTIKILDIRTRSRGIQIKFLSSQESCYIYGQLQNISQAIRHVLLNAIEAVEDRMDKDPGHPGEIQITLMKTFDEIQLTINDNGFGFSEENKSKIFNPLYSTKTSKQNAGLGLTKAFKIMTDHFGNLEISSKLGSGTSAKITLKRPDLKDDSQVFGSKI
jgi:two-component system NtrC family sensor kinase